MLGIVAVLVILAGLGTFLLGNDPADDATEPSGDAGRTASGETNPTESAPSGSASREAFVEDYYAVLPDDTETGWSRLTPGFQQEVGSYEDYDGFWSTIDSVTVEDVRAAGPAQSTRRSSTRPMAAARARCGGSSSPGAATTT